MTTLNTCNEHSNFYLPQKDQDFCHKMSNGDHWGLASGLTMPPMGYANCCSRFVPLEGLSKIPQIAIIERSFRLAEVKTTYLGKAYSTNHY